MAPVVIKVKRTHYMSDEQAAARGPNGACQVWFRARERQGNVKGIAHQCRADRPGSEQRAEHSKNKIDRGGANYQFVAIFAGQRDARGQRAGCILHAAAAERDSRITANGNWPCGSWLHKNRELRGNVKSGDGGRP